MGGGRQEMNESDLDIDLRIAERRARAWLAQRFDLVPVQDTEDLALYGFDPTAEWLFCVHDPNELRVGAARYVSVNRTTGQVRDHYCGE